MRASGNILSIATGAFSAMTLEIIDYFFPFRRRDNSAILPIALSPIYKYECTSVFVKVENMWVLESDYHWKEFCFLKVPKLNKLILQ